MGKENALTNFELRFDELGKKGLWLAAHHYDVDPSGTEECPDDETPVARRRRGWRFLLAEASELDELEWVAVDGELALARVLGEMVDVGQLMRSARLWLGTSNRSVAETIVHLFESFLLSRKPTAVSRAMRYRGTVAARKSSSTDSKQLAPGNHRTKQKPTIKKRTGWKDLKMRLLNAYSALSEKLCLGFIALVAWIGKRVL